MNFLLIFEIFIFQSLLPGIYSIHFPSHQQNHYTGHLENLKQPGFFLHNLKVNKVTKLKMVLLGIMPKESTVGKVTKVLN